MIAGRGAEPDPDRVLLGRARRAIALQTAAAITVSLLILGGLALVIVTRSQQAAAIALLRQTAATAEDVDDPPLAMWIYMLESDGRLATTSGAPAAVPDQAGLARVRAGATTVTTDIDGTEGGSLALTVRRGERIVQVVMSRREQHEESERLLGALALGELVGLSVAALSATLLARRAAAPLVDALSQQRHFVADASHELRTPLTQLHTLAQLLQMDVRAGASIREVTADVDHLVTGTRQLGEVVEDLLLSSQLSRRDEARLPVDLSAVAAEVVTDQGNRARAQGVELTLRSRSAGASVVLGHRVALRRVLTALVDNALSHTPRGGQVTVEVGADRDTVTVVVRDDGTGFDPADTERLFARFARGGTGDQRRFGLGLALAREVVIGHGGQLDATGRPGHGAAFAIRLPFGAIPSARGSVLADQGGTAAAGRWWRNSRVGAWFH